MMEWWAWLLIGWFAASVWTTILGCLWFRHLRHIEPDQTRGEG